MKLIDLLTSNLPQIMELLEKEFVYIGNGLLFEESDIFDKEEVLLNEDNELGVGVAFRFLKDIDDDFRDEDDEISDVIEIEGNKIAIIYFNI